MARLVVCCDGTWNTPNQLDQGVAAPTNVVKVYNSIAQGSDQKLYYHPGVGAGASWWDRAIAGGTGIGLSRNIKSAYEWLARSYHPGDDLFLFGFSRGAYTVRSLAGFIARCGLLRGETFTPETIYDAIDKLFTGGYRELGDVRALRAAIGDDRFHHRYEEQVPIRFIGVWDTVGSLGIPDDLGLLNLLDRPQDHTFHNAVLGKNVRTARQALAIDEQRKSFQPTLWTGPIQPDQDLQQLWFPGVHSDVGGGYREAGLANGALLWMVNEAARVGLVFKDNAVEQIVPDYLDMMHDPYTGVFAMLPTQPRSLPSWLDQNQYHSSAIRRHQNPPIHQSPYRQPHICADGRSVEIYARQQWNPTGIWLEEGKQYRFAATGQWVDSTIKCGPDGTEDDYFTLGELGHIGGAILGQIESAFRSLSGNDKAEFRFTRRHEKIGWFSLTGAIANAIGEAGEHETFKIGAACLYKPQRSGYLYAYSNDAWNCYANNKGYVLLTVHIAPAA